MGKWLREQSDEQRLDMFLMSRGQEQGGGKMACGAKMFLNRIAASGGEGETSLSVFTFLLLDCLLSLTFLCFYKAVGKCWWSVKQAKMGTSTCRLIPWKILPHSFLGSSDRSLQSLTESHTLELSMHSPFLHRNFRGPSHLVAAAKKETAAFVCTTAHTTPN